MIRKLFHNHPILRGMVSYAVIWPTASLVQQTMAGRRWRNDFFSFSLGTGLEFLIWPSIRVFRRLRLAKMRAIRIVRCRIHSTHPVRLGQADQSPVETFESAKSDYQECNTKVAGGAGNLRSVRDERVLLQHGVHGDTVSGEGQAWGASEVLAYVPDWPLLLANLSNPQFRVYSRTESGSRRQLCQFPLDDIPVVHEANGRGKGEGEATHSQIEEGQLRVGLGNFPKNYRLFCSEEAKIYTSLCVLLLMTMFTIV